MDVKWRYEKLWRVMDRAFWITVFQYAGEELPCGEFLEKSIEELQERNPNAFAQVLSYAITEICDFPVVVDVLPVPFCNFGDWAYYFMVATDPETNCCLTFFKLQHFATQLKLIAVPKRAFTLSELGSVIVNAAEFLADRMLQFQSAGNVATF